MNDMDPETYYRINFPDMTHWSFLEEFPFGDSSQANKMDCDEEEHPGGDSAIKNKWTLDDEKQLIKAVKECGTSWKTIMALYFEDTARNPNQLKQKWKEMIKTADKQKNAERKELYLEVRKLDDSLPKDKRNSRP